MKIACRLLILIFVAGALAPLRAQTFVNFEGKQTAPVRLSPDGSRLFAVNTPDNRLSVFDVSNPQNPNLIAETTVALPAPWATETSVRGVVGTEFNVTNLLAPNGRFFRLKGL